MRGRVGVKARLRFQVGEDPRRTGGAPFGFRATGASWASRICAKHARRRTAATTPDAISSSRCAGRGGWRWFPTDLAGREQRCPADSAVGRERCSRERGASSCDQTQSRCSTFHPLSACALALCLRVFAIYSSSGRRSADRPATAAATTWPPNSASSSSRRRARECSPARSHISAEGEIPILTNWTHSAWRTARAPWRTTGDSTTERIARSSG